MMSKSRSGVGSRIGGAPVLAGFALLLILVATLPCRAQSGNPFFEMEPGKIETFVFHCADASGRILSSCCTSSWLKGYYISSGGHLHNAGRPQSYATIGSYCYNNYQGIALTIDTRHNVGQWEYFDVCKQQGNCPTCQIYCGTTDLWIRYWPLYDYFGGGSPSHSRSIGQVSGYHVDNHYGTANLVSALDRVNQRYYGEFYCVPDARGIRGYQPVGVNDIGLEGGGIFDVKAPSGPSYAWRPPHSWHSKGNSVDLRCKPNADYSIIYVNEVIQRYMELCDAEGLAFQKWEDPGTSNEHVHCGVRAGN